MVPYVFFIYSLRKYIIVCMYVCNYVCVYTMYTTYYVYLYVCMFAYIKATD